MNRGSVSDVFAGLKQSARKRWEASYGGRTRVVAQVGHCSQAVGAGEVAAALEKILPADAYLVTAGCDGACFEAPAVVIAYPSGEQRRLPRMPADAVSSLLLERPAKAKPGVADGTSFIAQQRRIALDRCGALAASELDEYLLSGGYAGLARALEMTPEEVIQEVKASGLRGRGGAYFPAALKWQGARGVNKEPRYLVVNSEEGEPGIFKDRHLMEGVPHRILEGAAIAAYASGVHQAYIYINAEADLSAQRVQQALEQAYARGLLGENILGEKFSLNVEIRRGAGGYVCGEETTLLNTMEGYRREPRVRPPFPTEAGLWGKPTIINNPETLASVPYILANGAQAFAQVGTETDKGTKIISLSGSVQRPGVAEVPMGTTLRQIVSDLGGGPPPGRRLTAVAVGGPSSGLLPPSMLDTAIRPGLLHDSGVMLGAGGVIALDESNSIIEMVRQLAAYNAAESCGKCTPCREGTPRMVEAINRLISGPGTTQDLEELRYLAQVVGAASLCGLGQAAGNPVTSSLHFFGEEFTAKAGTQ